MYYVFRKWMKTASLFIGLNLEDKVYIFSLSNIQLFIIKLQNSSLIIEN